MATLVAYYSYTGHSRALAQRLASEESADTAEIKDVKRPLKLKAYTAGCLAAMRGKPWAIQPLESDLAGYDRIVLFAPVWANNPAPAINAFVAQLPKGKAVSVKMVSASGKSNCKDRLEAAIKSKGCSLDGFEDINSRNIK